MTISRHQQLFTHDPENGVYGDCFRTVIACLLNLRPVDVTHFCNGPDDGNTMDRVRAFLEPRGLALIEVPFVGEQIALADILKIGENLSQGLYWILTGSSRNGVNHVVICQGAEIVHDTSLDQSGIVGPGIDGMWWVGWLVARVDAPPTADIARVERIEARLAEINELLGDGQRADWMRPLEDEFTFHRGQLAILCGQRASSITAEPEKPVSRTHFMTLVYQYGQSPSQDGFDQIHRRYLADCDGAAAAAKGAAQ